MSFTPEVQAVHDGCAVSNLRETEIEEGIKYRQQIIDFRAKGESWDGPVPDPGLLNVPVERQQIVARQAFNCLSQRGNGKCIFYDVHGNKLPLQRDSTESAIL